MSALVQPDQLAELRCPACRGQLLENDHGVSCSDCGQQFRIDEGLPDLRLSRFDYYFNPIPRDRMRSLSRELDAGNWSRSVREFVDLGPSVSWIDNIAVPGRYAWKFLMELAPGSQVLDIGCGLGAMISNIAPHVDKAYATDLTMERLVFVNRRVRIFNPDDCVRTVASGDGPHLPFPDASFDAVFLSGVLEWVGEGDTSTFSSGNKWQRLINMLRAHFGDTNPRQIQLKFLREIARILKPDGQLYIGIENRFSYEYFGHRRDHHSALWFGSLLPRFVATLYSIAAKRRPYRTYTYGIDGYKKLLAEAGLGTVELFSFNDGYSNLKSIAPATARLDRWRPVAPETLRQWMRYHPRLAPAFGIFASRSAEQGPRFLDRLLGEIETALGTTTGFSGFTISDDDNAVLRGTADDKAIIVKLPMSVTSTHREVANAGALSRIHESNPALAAYVPTHLQSGVHQAQRYFVESCLPGTPLPAASLRTPDAIRSLSAVLDLAARQSKTDVFGEDHFAEYIQPRIELLKTGLDDPADADAISAFFRAALIGMSFQSGFMHGDLRREHALFANGTLSGLVNWHASSLNGLPVVDAMALAALEACVDSGGETLPAFLTRLANGSFKDSVAEAALGSQFRAGEFSATERSGLVYLYWLYHVTNQLPYRLQYDSSALRKLVLPVVDTIGKNHSGAS